jgi:hypothetical protein
VGLENTIRVLTSCSRSSAGRAGRNVVLVGESVEDGFSIDSVLGEDWSVLLRQTDGEPGDAADRRRAARRAPVARVVPTGGEPAVPGQQCRGRHRKDPGPAPPQDEPRERGHNAAALSSCRIGCAGVVVGAGLRLVAVRVYGRSMAGSSGVPHRSIAVMSLAGSRCRTARHVMRRASCPRRPRAASLFAGIGPASFGGSVNDGRADRISRVGHFPAHARPGEWRASAAAGRWLSGVPGRSRTAVGQ